MIPLQELLPIRKGDTQDFTFDFTGIVASATTLDSKAVAIALYSGTGTLPTLGTSSISGQTVVVPVTVGNTTSTGCIYKITVTATFSTGQVLQKSGILAITQ